MAEIKFCDNNFSFGTKKAMKKLMEKYTNVYVSVGSCIGCCGNCETGPYALVNDRVVQADTAEELFNKIETRILSS